MEVATTLNTTVVEVPWDVNVFGRHNDVLLYFHMSDLLDLAYINLEINITVLQFMDDVSSNIKYIITNLLKFSYICGLCFNEGKQNIYGLLNPKLIQSLGNKKSKTQTYINTTLKNGGKQIYFALYIHEYVHIN